MVLPPELVTTAVTSEPLRVAVCCGPGRKEKARAANAMPMMTTAAMAALVLVLVNGLEGGRHPLIKNKHLLLERS